MKDDKKHHESDHHRERDPGTSNSLLVPDSLRGTDKRRNGPDYSNDVKKRKVDDKDTVSHYDSDGDKSDDNLVVDVSNEDPSSPRGSPAHSPRENGLDKSRLLKKDASSSPASTASSGSSSSLKSKELGHNQSSSVYGRR
ncbi:transducin-like enhancer protein 1 [Rhincodon typus]|uniref:transducin-like enhancer protein 1 n=1 Tax=Rhincodon typus TaxID=259920 RepID=UPI00202F1B6D|nr:transducin-like enhancer protein 1 [Rhincodon typus]